MQQKTCPQLPQQFQVGAFGHSEIDLLPRQALELCGGAGKQVYPQVTAGEGAPLPARPGSRLAG